ncbi:hypothetical protein [Burkholderia glumae]
MANDVEAFRSPSPIELPVADEYRGYRFSLAHQLKASDSWVTRRIP